MSQLTRCIVLLLVVHSVFAATLDIVSVPGNEACPTQDRRDAAIQSVRDSVDKNLVISLNCGSGQWYCVAQLNMSNSSQQCPSAWREYSSSGVRGCRRPETSSGSCHATFHPISHQYTRVCGLEAKLGILQDTYMLYVLIGGHVMQKLC